MVVHDKYQQHLQELFSPVDAAAVTRERLSISVVLKLFQFPEHLTVMLLSMERVKILFSCYSKYEHLEWKMLHNIILRTQSEGYLLYARTTQNRENLSMKITKHYRYVQYQCYAGARVGNHSSAL